MTDLTSFALHVPTQDNHHLLPPLQPETTETLQATAMACGAIGVIDCGRVRLDNRLLRRLRQTRLMSQQDLADDCWRRNIQVSIATIKRAEAGRAVRFRIARAFARCFDIPVVQLLQGMPDHAAPH